MEAKIMAEHCNYCQELPQCKWKALESTTPLGRKEAKHPPVKERGGKQW